MEEADRKAEKKKYHSPNLVTYGDVRHLTETGPGNQNQDAYQDGEYQMAS